MSDTAIRGATPKKSLPTGHAFPGVAGEAADLMAAVARRLAQLPRPTATGTEELSLLHKRFHAALALSRHDPHAARRSLAALLERLSTPS
ncbi:MAG TPA: hypothetical protein VFX33_05185 [Actinomycetales bacterium]|nr:hypothetical protein [Actinomycetales bacterium]